MVTQRPPPERPEPPPSASGPNRAVLTRFLFARPLVVPTINAALRWHFDKKGAPFRWWDVNALQRTLDALVIDRILAKTGPGLYTVADYDTMVDAVRDYNAEIARFHAREARKNPPSALAAPPLPPGVPRDLFSDIVGYQSVKVRLRVYLAARKPVHALLWGPPGTSKTIFLLGLKTLPGALFYYGNTMSPPGIRKLFLDQKPPYLIIDELDKMPRKSQEMLLGAMSEGQASVLQFGDNRLEDINIRIFAAANDPSRLLPELFSRFEDIKLPEYTPEEFAEVAYKHLTKTGVPSAIAKIIAEGIALKSKDLRDAIRIGNAARDVQWAHYLVDLLGRESRV